MIGFLSKWIEGIAIAVIIASIFEMIIPNGNIKKYIKIILGIYIIFSIINPFVDSKSLYTIDASEEIDKYMENKDISNNINGSQEDLNKIYIQTFEKEIKETVEKQGYNVYKCTVNGIFDAENKNAGISKIEIILESKKESKEQENEGEDENEEELQNKIEIQNIEEIEKVEIQVNKKTAISKNTKEISLQDINELKKFLSEHYEVDKKIICVIWGRFLNVTDYLFHLGTVLFGYMFHLGTVLVCHK